MHPKNLLAKQPKTTTPRILATYPMTLNCQGVIKKILLSLDTSKAAGMDQILAKFLKDGAEVLDLPLRNIIKLSTFPKESKIAKIEPIIKKGTRTDPKNYRLVSLLPPVSRIVQKLIRFQIENYLNKEKLIYIYQSGFWTNHSITFVWLS